MKFSGSAVPRKGSRACLTAGRGKISLASLVAVFIFLGSVFGFHYFWAKANPSAKVQFSADAILSLSGISDGALYVAQGSECNSLAVSGSALSASGIPDGSNFILKTSQHSNALKLSPSGGSVGLIFSAGNLAASAGTISRWTLDNSGSGQIAHVVGVSKADTWYEVNVAGALFDTVKSSASGEINFTYNGGFSSKVFTLEEVASEVFVKKKKTYQLDNGIKLRLKGSNMRFTGRNTDFARGIAQIFQDGSLKKNGHIKRNGRWKVNVKEKSKSVTHTYQFRYLNSASGEILASNASIITIDQQNPAFTYLPKRIYASPGDTITWQASDNDQISYYRITFRGKKSVSTENSFALPASTPRGKSKLTVRVYDRAGNWKTRRARVRVR